MNDIHYRRLEHMYLSAPINEFYRPRATIGQGVARIAMDVDEKFYHAMRAVHGAVYFKMMDDAAFFAANSVETEFFLLTTSFTTYLTRPVSDGFMRAEGRLLNSNKSQFIAEAVVFDAQDREIGRGSGIFVRSKKPLAEAEGYRLPS